MDVLIIAIGYLLGSIPFGLIVGKKFYGIDLREHGSNNTGATNAFRVLGPKAALLVGVPDMLKGLLAVYFAQLFSANPLIMVVAGIAAICGHNWSMWMKFKGGRGVATSVGVLLMLAPKVVGVVLIVFIILVGLTRYVSLGSITGGVLVPFLMWYFNYPLEIKIFGIVVAIFIVLRHRANIKRLLSGTENKVKPGNAKRKN
ncbi:MAG: glycerol-3-phosphate 1-O-acyltransferase PlsY [Negativicutes bacterium]|jgi:glycerol-3-phosphate acyltransferase PlsY